ncbi:hypothetical protein BMS3Bbin16_01191 [archaeon BMS3Bbin16]|nr:hypothetical protein BMS3Bbin16_01191 [archaeon BMS3Bbin16]
MLKIVLEVDGEEDFLYEVKRMLEFAGLSVTRETSEYGGAFDA